MKLLKILNWLASGIAASFVGYFAFDHLERVFLSVFTIPAHYYWTAYILAIASPACLAVAWLRLTGLTWRQALGLFLFAPAGVYILWYMANVLLYRFAS